MPPLREPQSSVRPQTAKRKVKTSWTLSKSATVLLLTLAENSSKPRCLNQPGKRTDNLNPVVSERSSPRLDGPTSMELRNQELHLKFNLKITLSSGKPLTELTPVRPIGEVLLSALK